jgi:succinate-semialdehyde dehydrogenase/glutarate-semialdehyde dehydrogenase
MNLQREIPLRRMMYGGGWHAALDGATFESLNPATGEVIAQVPLGGAADARAAVDAAHAAFPAWSRRTAADRALLIHRVADRLEARREEIAAAITREEGKPLLESRIEMRLTIDSLHWYAEEARRAYGSWIPDPVPNRRLLTMRQPVGVCGAIIPWNVPAAMITRKAGPALATGCTMVLKPAEQTPVTATLIAEAFLEADLPPGVFNVVVGDAPAIGQALLGDERVRKISFTGSTEVGRLLLRGAAEHIKRVSLELGGNAPVILFEDCNLDRAIPALCALKFLNAGQACISANRIYVQSSIHDEVAARIQAHAARLKVGDGLQEGVTMGPLIEPEAVAKLDGMVQEAVADGAALLSGGGRLSDPAHANGFFFAPTVISGMKPGMRMARQEIFGPIAPLFRFDTEAEAVAAANDVPYGLAAYLFTEDMGRAIRVCERLETGMVGVNDIRIGAAEAPFGGVKQSGIGREGGREGMEEYLETKLVALRVDPEA